jgi:2-dehydropantoate 2-reductase
MRIAIVGSGAVGLYYGSRLQKAGEDLHYLLRSDYDAVQRNGIRIRARDGHFQLNDVNAYRNSEDIGEVDLVIVAVKAVSNEILPELLRPIVAPETAILSLQNGLGDVEFLRACFPDNPLFCGTCYICLNRVEPGVVENFLLGSMVLSQEGEANSNLLKTIGEMLNRARLNCRISPDIDRMRWEKLLWDVPFNGLSIVAGRITTDLILADEGLNRLARGLIEELLGASSAMGLSIDPRLVDRQFEITKSMGEYSPSSLLDFLAGRRVEVEAIWGEPLRQGLKAGQDMPKLETLYRLLRTACRDQQT